MELSQQQLIAIFAHAYGKGCSDTEGGVQGEPHEEAEEFFASDAARAVLIVELSNSADGRQLGKQQ